MKLFMDCNQSSFFWGGGGGVRIAHRLRWSSSLGVLRLAFCPHLTGVPAWFGAPLPRAAIAGAAGLDTWYMSPTR